MKLLFLLIYPQLDCPLAYDVLKVDIAFVSLLHFYGRFYIHHLEYGDRAFAVRHAAIDGVFGQGNASRFDVADQSGVELLCLRFGVEIEDVPMTVVVPVGIAHPNRNASVAVVVGVAEVEPLIEVYGFVGAEIGLQHVFCLVGTANLVGQTSVSKEQQVADRTLLHVERAWCGRSADLGGSGIGAVLPLTSAVSVLCICRQGREQQEHSGHKHHECAGGFCFHNGHRSD